MPRADLVKAKAKSSPEEPAADGCLAGVIRLPVRVFAFAVVVPLRFLWELLCAVLHPVGAALAWCGRLLGRVLYGVLVWPFAALYRYLLIPLGRLAVRLLKWSTAALYRYLLAPFGRLVVWLLKWSAGALHRYLLAPFGRGLAWIGRSLALPALRALVTYLLAPLGRALVRLLTVLLVIPAAWLRRVALPWCGRLLGRVLYGALVWPFAALYRYLLAPFGRGLAWIGRSLALPALRALVTYLLAPLGRALVRLLTVLLVIPAAWLWRVALPWCGRTLLLADIAVGRMLAWSVRQTLRGLVLLVHHLVEYLVVWPVRLLGRHLLLPAARALSWLVRVLLLTPLGWLWRTAVSPVLHGLVRAVVWAWRLGGRIWRYLVLRPWRWLLREVWWPVRDELRLAVRAARETIATTMREVRRAFRG